MGSLLYFRLIGYTAGTLLQLFWMVVILGYLRQRNFERVFFFLCLSLFLFYAEVFHLAYDRIPLLLQEAHFNFLVPGSSLGEGFALLLAAALAWCAIWQWRFTLSAPDRPQRYFHTTLLLFFTLSFLAV